VSEPDGFQPGVPCWVDTMQPDPGAAVEFYGGLFGWEFEGPGEMPGDPPGQYFVARLRGRDAAGVGSKPPGDSGPSALMWNTYIEVESVDSACASARDAGGSVVVGPVDVSPAGRLAAIADPQGAVFCLWEPGERKGAQVINEPSAWAMSILNTRDLDAAKDFYGPLFGWETDTFGSGDEAIGMWRLPGYVGGKPEQPVPRDVVGAMAPMGDRFPDGVPPHWAVNFWVHDADETAERTNELGGEVVAGPFDSQVSRDAVIADPQGAVLSVSTAPGPPPE
jgi:uncharacterized protein